MTDDFGFNWPWSVVSDAGAPQTALPVGEAQAVDRLASLVNLERLLRGAASSVEVPKELQPVVLEALASRLSERRSLLQDGSHSTAETRALCDHLGGSRPTPRRSRPSWESRR